MDLDLVGMDVSSVEVSGRAASWERDGQELVITPARGARRGSRYRVEVACSSAPQTVDDEFGLSGSFHTDDGALVVGEPHVASTWFPCSDHPGDKASFALRLTVPDGLEVVSNGELAGRPSATPTCAPTAPTASATGTPSTRVCRRRSRPVQASARGSGASVHDQAQELLDRIPATSSSGELDATDPGRARGAGTSVTTDDFRALAAEVSGQDVDALLTTWLSTPSKPAP